MITVDRENEKVILNNYNPPVSIHLSLKEAVDLREKLDGALMDVDAKNPEPFTHRGGREMKCYLESKIEAEVHLLLPEGEARALVSLLGYDTDDFLKFFYEKMGTVYLKPHEKSFRKLVLNVHNQIKPVLKRVDKARKIFDES
jgi:hypothetical protein